MPVDLQSLSPIRVACDVEPRRQSLDTIQSPGLAVVDRVRRDEEWY